MERLTNLFETLLSMALTALPVMAVVLLARLALRKAPKRYSYALWLVVAFRLVCPVSIATEVSIIPQDLPWRITAEMADDSVGGRVIRDSEGNREVFDRAVEDQPVYGGELGAYYVVTAPDGISVPDTAAGSAGAVLPAAAVLWVLGMAVAVGYITWSVLRLRKQVSTAVRRERNVWECDGIPTPFVLGLLRARIYIPFRLSEEERAYVLAHEQYHIRHLDHWAKALALGILVVYWWNPAVWLCWVLFCRDMEMRCDEAVLAKLGEDVKRGYSLSLVSFALDRRFPAALAFGEHDAARRVKNVLKWKRAKPVVVVIGSVVVIAVALVCGTNASTASRVTTEMDGMGVHMTAKFKDSVKSWAIYEDVYQDGRLISSSPRVMDGFAEDGTGVSSRKFEAALRVEPIFQEDGLIVSNELHYSVEAYGTYDMTLTLPGLDYTGMAAALGNGDLEHSRDRMRDSIETGGEVLLYSVLLSTKPEGAVIVYRDGMRLTKDNDVVVQYRLVTSAGGIGTFEDAPLDLAQTLYDLRVETLNDREDPGALGAIRTLLDAMGVGEMGEYELALYGTDRENAYLSALYHDDFWTDGIYGGENGLLIRFLEPEDEEKSAGKWGLIKYLIQALIPDLEEVNRYYPAKPTSGSNQSYDLFMDGDDWIAEHLGYESLEELGRSAKGVRALLGYFAEREDPLDDLARKLFSLRADSAGERPAVERMLTAMNTEDLGDFTVEWLDGETVQVNFSALNVSKEEMDQEMLGRAAMIMAVGKEIRQVNWCSIPDSNYTVYFDRAQPDAWARNLGYKDLADLGRTIEGLEKLLNYLRFDVTGSGAALLELAASGDRWALMEALMEADLWDGPVTQSARVTTTANFDVTLVFDRAPQDPEALDVAMARRAMVLLKLLPTEVNRVCWSYPGENDVEHRMIHANEEAGIAMLSSDSRIYQSVKTAEDLDRFISFLNLDPKVFLSFAGAENSLSQERVAEASAVWFAPEDIHDIEYAVLEWWDGQRFYPLTGEGYDYLEERLSTAKRIGATGCPFQTAVLYLHRADGVVGKVIPAADSCDVFQTNHAYYQYGDRAEAPYYDDNSDFYAVFGVSVEELPHYVSEGTVSELEEPVAFVTELLRREEVGHLLDDYRPANLIYNMDVWQDETQSEVPGFVYYTLTRAQFRQFLRELDPIPEELQDVELEGNARDIARIAVTEEWSRAEWNQLLLRAAGTEPTVGGPVLSVVSPEEEAVLAAWYEDGQFDWDYDSLPTLTLTLPGTTPLSHIDPYALTLTLSGGEAETLTVGEDYYAKTGTGTRVEKNTYELQKSGDGIFWLTVQRRNEDQSESAVYFVPYEGGKFVFRVELPPIMTLPEGSVPFTDILGYDGYIQTENTAAPWWKMRTYYAVSGGEIFPIAESFGFGEAQDYSVDLDGDGVKELVTNVQFGGDGHEDVYVYRRVADGPGGIQKGVPDLSDLPNHNNWGVNSTAASYDPETGLFRIRYAQKGTEEYGELEFRGLERFEFSAFQKST